MTAIRRFARACARWTTCILPLLAAALPAHAQPTAVEFYHAGYGHYFFTVDPNEAAILDSGRIPGWHRTGETFAVDGSEAVCRFFTGLFANKGSHFYTPYATECDNLRGGGVWTFEGLVFRVDLPDAGGACRAGTRPLFRLYNDGRSGAPNHRYTVRSDLVAQMRAQGWKSEGTGADPVFACVPGATTTPPPQPPAAGGLTGRWTLAAGVRTLTEAEAASITSLGDTEVRLSQAIGLTAGQVFIVPDQGAWRVVAVFDDGRTLAVVPATIDELFDELEVEGRVPLQWPEASSARTGAKALLDPDLTFHKADLDGMPGGEVEFKLEADCSSGGGRPKFELITAKFGVFGTPEVKLSKRSSTYDVSGVRVVFDGAVKLGCKLAGDSGARFLKRLPGRIPTTIPGVVLRIDFGPSVAYETDIPGVVQLASAKVDGILDRRSTPPFNGTLNGTPLRKASILAQIAGDIGVTYTGSVSVAAEVRVWVNVAFVDIAALGMKAGPKATVTVALTQNPKLCGAVSMIAEAFVMLRGGDPRSIYKTEVQSPPNDWDRLCNEAPGPTGTWLFNRTSCEILPGSQPTCTCPGQTLRVNMTEFSEGAFVDLAFPDFGGQGIRITQETTSRYQGCNMTFPGAVECVVVNFDLPAKRSAAMGGSVVTSACQINSGWQGAMQ